MVTAQGLAVEVVRVSSMTEAQRLGAEHGVHLTRGWILNGVGPARFGWGVIEPLRTRWLGRTLDDVRAALRGEA